MERQALEALEFGAATALVALHAAGPLGAERVRSERPCAERGEIERRLRQAGEMVRLLGEGDAPALSDAGDPGPALGKLDEGRAPLEPKELLEVARFLAAAEGIRDALAERDDVPALREEARGIADFAAVRAGLGDAVDADGSIPDRASPRLARLRREIAALEGEIEAKVEALLRRPALRGHLQSRKPVWRDGRVLLAVKSGSRGRIAGVLHERSGSGATAFVEPPELVEPGNRLADLRARERREAASVLLEATRRLLAVRPRLGEARARVAVLDAALAKARFAREAGASLPSIDAGRALDLRGARHPLLQDAVRRRLPGAPSEVVPIDVRLGTDFDLLLLTGPNTGGKTVALKTAGLLATLALAGFPVLASPGASVPLYDALFVDIGDEQEIAQSLSTFSSHLRRIAPALDRAGDHSLVLLDELGSGTDPAEGAALARAVLERLLARGASVLATTHLGPLKSLAYVHPRAENASVEFDAATLRPLYRLRIGLPGESNALAVARRLGLPEEVVEKALASLASESHPLDRAIDEVRDRRIEAEAAREEARRLAEEAGRERAELEVRRRELEEARRSVGAEAEAVVEESFARARAAVEEEIRRSGSAGAREGLERLRESLAAAMRATPFGERRLAFLRGLRRDDLVYLRRFRRRCPVRRVDFEREVLSVLVGGMRMEVPFDEVSFVEPPPGPA
ncbi:MAG TPA: hypothetical protein VFI25_18615 [Planctomycetota bacterium]|nr:hypothetical protein [Planctomycetota bacterium]